MSEEQNVSPTRNSDSNDLPSIYNDCSDQSVENDDVEQRTIEENVNVRRSSRNVPRVDYKLLDRIGKDG